MFKLLFSLLLINLFLFGLGAGWFGFKPSEVKIGAPAKPPIEFRPQAFTFPKQ